MGTCMICHAFCTGTKQDSRQLSQPIILLSACHLDAFATGHLLQHIKFLKPITALMNEPFSDLIRHQREHDPALIEDENHLLDSDGAQNYNN